MDGVLILNSMVQYGDDSGFMIAGICSLFFIILVVAPIVYGIYDGNIPCGLIFLAIGFVISFLFVFYKAANIEKYFVYEVTISEDVKFKEFMNRYDIIDKRGEIYVVRDRVE